jgi:hypothetical protein
MRRVLVLTPVLLILAQPAAAIAEEWRWPVRGPLLERFSYSGRAPFVPGRHRGVDIAAPEGTPVRSACSGRVSFAGGAAHAGRTVSVRCGALTASYLHLASVSVRRGDTIAAGRRLGAVGRSGRPRRREPHLHFGVRWTGRRWQYVDPLTLLGEPPPFAVPLLPASRPGTRQPLGPAPRAPRPAAVPSGRPLPVPVSRPVTAPAAPREPRPVPLGVWVALAVAACALPGGRLVHRGRRAARARQGARVAPRSGS